MRARTAASMESGCLVSVTSSVVYRVPPTSSRTYCVGTARAASGIASSYRLRIGACSRRGVRGTRYASDERG